MIYESYYALLYCVKTKNVQCYDSFNMIIYTLQILRVHKTKDFSREQYGGGGERSAGGLGKNKNK
jgi:hypothetical protein